MKKENFLSITVFHLLLLTFISCEGQINNQSGLKDVTASVHQSKKIIKNHFITKYPDEFFFVQCGLQDKQGNMWFGTAGDGIFCYDGKSFYNFTAKDGLCHNDILCCLEDDKGIIWFGTRNGLIRYKPSGNQAAHSDFTNFRISDYIYSGSTHQKTPYTYAPASNFVWSMLQDRSGKLWVAANKGIYIYDSKTAISVDTPAFTPFLDLENLQNDQNLHLMDVTDLLEDKNGNIWFVSGYEKGEGICRYGYSGDGTNQKSLTSFRPDSVRSFRAILERKNGTLLFLSTNNGVYSYDPTVAGADINKFTNFSEQIGLKTDPLITMIEDKTGALWFGTNSENMQNGGDGGVWRYNPSASKSNGEETISLFSTTEGLSHNCVFCIVEDKDGNIWFGTRNTGLCRYNAGRKDKQGKFFTDFTE